MLLLDFYGEETCLMPTVVCVQSAATARSQRQEIERTHCLLVRKYAIETDVVWLYRRLAMVILNSNSI